MPKHPYDFSVEGALAMVDDVKRLGLKDDLQNQRWHEYLEAARQSWQYRADSRFRKLVKQLFTHSETFMEGCDRLAAAELEEQMANDRKEKAREALIDALCKSMPAFYASGDRSDNTLQGIVEIVFRSLVERGLDLTPDTVPPLTEQDIEDIIEVGFSRGWLKDDSSGG